MQFSSSISFTSEDVSFKLDNQNEVALWIIDIINKEGKIPGEISYIFCSDDFLHNINIKYLNHDTYTDIITFNYCEEKIINSDIFISIDRVKENSKTYKTSFHQELMRVIIHGVLHLLGYNDKTANETKEMRAKEDFYLSLLPI